MPEQKYRSADQQWEGETASARYRQARSTVPQKLIDRLLEFTSMKLSKPFGTVLDVGCGTGQSTEMLSRYFQKTIGMDSSSSQIGQAKLADQSGRISYLVGSADQLPVADNSVDLITAIQAAHWFDHRKFAAECGRVLKPGGVLSIIFYDHANFRVPGVAEGEKVGKLIRQIIVDTQDHLESCGYFHPNVHYLMNKYVELDEVFTFTKGNDDLLMRNDNNFNCYEPASLDSIMAWMATWSGIQHYSAANPGRDIVREIREKIVAVLNEYGCANDGSLEVQYPWSFLAYRKPS